MKEVDQYYKDLAVETIEAVGMEFGGVDIITPDISKKVKCGINEINYNPGLRLHYKVTEGEVVKVAVPIMEYIRDKYLNLQ
jgi:glutathione synthase/RimK-type ligase-like ATP-grasp enzyme